MPLKPINFETVQDDTRVEPQPGVKARRGRPPGSRTNSTAEAQIRDELTACLKLVAMVWSTRDPICAPILNQQSELIADDIAKLAGRSKWARKYLTRVSEVGSYLPLLMHLQPILTAVHAHHIAPRPLGEDEPQNDPGIHFVA